MRLKNRSKLVEGSLHDKSSLVVPTFLTKVPENLCSCEFFFLRTNLYFLTSHFRRNI